MTFKQSRRESLSFSPSVLVLEPLEEEAKGQIWKTVESKRTSLSSLKGKVN